MGRSSSIAGRSSGLAAPRRTDRSVVGRRSSSDPPDARTPPQKLTGHRCVGDAPAALRLDPPEHLGGPRVTQPTIGERRPITRATMPQVVAARHADDSLDRALANERRAPEFGDPRLDLDCDDRLNRRLEPERRRHDRPVMGRATSYMDDGSGGPSPTPGPARATARAVRRRGERPW